MLTIRLESRDSSCVKSNRLTGSRFARDLEKKKKAKRLSTLGRVGNVDDSTRFDSNRAIRLA